MSDNDGKLDAKEVAEILKEWQKELKRVRFLIQFLPRGK